MVDLTVSWTYRAVYANYFVHSLPLNIHELLWSMGQCDSYLFPSAQHRDSVGGGLLYAYHHIQSRLFHSFPPNSNGDPLHLKNCNSRYLQKVHSSFRGYYVCPQKHLLREFCKAVFLAFFPPSPMKIANNGRKCSYMQYSTLERHRSLSTIS